MTAPASAGTSFAIFASSQVVRTGRMRPLLLVQFPVLPMDGEENVVATGLLRDGAVAVDTLDHEDLHTHAQVIIPAAGQRSGGAYLLGAGRRRLAIVEPCPIVPVGWPGLVYDADGTCAIYFNLSVDVGFRAAGEWSDWPHLIDLTGILTCLAARKQLLAMGATVVPASMVEGESA